MSDSDSVVDHTCSFHFWSPTRLVFFGCSRVEEGKWPIGRTSTGLLTQCCHIYLKKCRPIHLYPVHLK